MRSARSRARRDGGGEGGGRGHNAAARSNSAMADTPGRFPRHALCAAVPPVSVSLPPSTTTRTHARARGRQERAVAARRRPGSRPAAERARIERRAQTNARPRALPLFFSLTRGHQSQQRDEEGARHRRNEGEAARGGDGKERDESVDRFICCCSLVFPPLQTTQASFRARCCSLCVRLCVSEKSKKTPAFFFKRGG